MDYKITNEKVNKERDEKDKPCIESWTQNIGSDTWEYTNSKGVKKTITNSEKLLMENNKERAENTTLMIQVRDLLQQLVDQNKIKQPYQTK